MLDQARIELASRNYPAAQRAAEAVLAGLSLPAVRAQALLVAGEAEYGMGLYDQAAQRYGEFLAKNGHDPEAPQAALTLGWSEARLGQFGRAERTWSRISRVFPDDERAHLGLLLSAHAAAQAGDLPGARRWLDELVTRYPISSSATVGRLSRSIIAVRTGHEKDAAPDLRELIRTRQLCAAKERQSLLQGLTRGGADAPLFRIGGRDCQPLAAGSPTLQQFAAPFLEGAGDPETTPAILHALVRLGAEDRLWTDVRVLSTDLVTEYPGYPSIPTLLAGVANQAAVDHQWSIVRGTYEQLLAAYPASPLQPTARLDFAESLLRTGEPIRAQKQIAQAASADRSHEQAARRLFLQGQIYETLGRPGEALIVYQQLGREHPRSEWAAESLLPRARVMDAVGQRRQARALLEHILKGAQGDVYSEAAVRLGESLEAEGQHAAAVKWFLTAAYLDPESTWGQRAQLGALEGLIATGDRAAADAVYRRMEASNATDPGLLSRARDALDGRSRGR
jgi:TolA-binding protein